MKGRSYLELDDMFYKGVPASRLEKNQCFLEDLEDEGGRDGAIFGYLAVITLTII
jgi:hypothetical protein